MQDFEGCRYDKCGIQRNKLYFEARRISLDAAQLNNAVLTSLFICSTSQFPSILFHQDHFQALDQLQPTHTDWTEMGFSVENTEKIEILLEFSVCFAVPHSRAGPLDHNSKPSFSKVIFPSQDISFSLRTAALPGLTGRAN